MKLDNNKAHAALFVLGLIYALLAVSAASTKSITNDELVHIPAGYYYLKTGDFRMNTEHPPLIKEISAIPLLALKPEYSTTDVSWKNNKEWELGAKFFYRYNHNADQIIFWARLPMILIGLIGMLYLFWWAQEVYGNNAAVLAASLYAVNPNLLAHSPLVTTDIGIMVFGIATLYHFRKFLAKKTYRTVGMTSLFFGFSMASKYTALYLIPIMFVIAIVYELIVRENKHVYKLWSFYTQLAWVAIVVAISLLVVILTYGIIGAPSYLTGLSQVLYHGTTGHRGFLMGEYSEKGWISYFAIAFLIKEPIPWIIMIGLACVASYLMWKKEDLLEEAMLMGPALMFFILFSFGRIDIGIRHIFVIYPLLMVWCGKILNVEVGKRYLIAIVGILFLWYAAETAYAYPDYLTYFNEFGKPGYNMLIDSNIDWGQDLKGLAGWLRDHNNPDLQLAYFGNDDRDYRNITWTELKCGPRSGLIAISVNILDGFTKEESQCSGWLKQHAPVDSIGGSILIYNISQEDATTEIGEYCKEKCVKKCKDEGLVFKESVYNETCKCRCL